MTQGPFQPRYGYVDPIEARLNTILQFVRELDQRLRVLEQRGGIGARAEMDALRRAIDESNTFTDQQIDRAFTAARRNSADIATLRDDLTEKSRVVDQAAADLVALKNTVLGLQQQFDATQTDALYLANLAYAYALMAQHWVVARDRVRAVIGEPTTGQTLLKVSTSLLATSFSLALTGVTGGLATGLFHAFAAPVVKIFGGLADTIGASSHTTAQAPTPGSAVDTSGIRTDLAKDSAVPVIGGVLGSFAGALTPQPWEPGDPGGTMTDPLQFFLDLEKELRNTAIVLANQRGSQFGTRDFSAAYRTNTKAGFEQAKQDAKLKDLQDDPFWGFLFRPMASDQVEANWAIVGKLLAVRMRRMAWRMYCRAQWSNSLWSNTVCVDSAFTDTADPSWTTDDPSDWPRKVWSSQGGGWPAHWEVICSDFRGPEHIPSHPVNSPAEQAHATKREKRMAWISMAVVQCCQVKRDFGLMSKAMRIDLERNVHIAGVEGGQIMDSGEPGAATLIQRRDVNVHDALFKEESVARPLCEQIMTRGGILVRISEVRFGSEGGSRFTRASGKKGRLVAPNNWDDPEIWSVAPGGRVTVCLTSTEKTTRDAKIYLVQPTKVMAGGAVANYTIGRDGDGAPTSHLQMAEKNFATSCSQWTNLTAPTQDGVYCITLSSRNELLKESAMRTRQMHVPSLWWFKVGR